MPSVTVHLGRSYQTVIQVRQHTLIADEFVQDGGTDVGPTPMELLSGALAGCVAVTTRAFAQRKNWPLDGLTVTSDLQRFKREEYPNYSGEPDAQYITEIRQQIQFEGPLSEEQRARLMTIAKKCPVHLVLENPIVFIEEEVNPALTTP